MKEHLYNGPLQIALRADICYLTLSTTHSIIFSTIVILQYSPHVAGCFIDVLLKFNITYVNICFAF